MAGENTLLEPVPQEGIPSTRIDENISTLRESAQRDIGNYMNTIVGIAVDNPDIDFSDDLQAAKNQQTLFQALNPVERANKENIPTQDSEAPVNPEEPGTYVLVDLDGKRTSLQVIGRENIEKGVIFFGKQLDLLITLTEIRNLPNQALDFLNSIPLETIETFLRITKDISSLKEMVDRYTQIATEHKFYLPDDDRFELAVWPDGRWELMLLDLHTAKANYDNPRNPNILSYNNERFGEGSITTFQYLPKRLSKLHS